MTTEPAGPPRIFISYRREETAAHAGRLYDAIAAHFGERNVFMDVDLAPGLDFVDRITEAVGACDVLLVVMGPRWATLADGGDRPRLADPNDFVRLEVETALGRTDVTVIPLLVAGARMPAREQLPDGLQPLLRRNALELRDLRWRDDVQRLVSALAELLEAPPAAAEPPRAAAPGAPRAARPHRRARLLLGGALAAGAVIVLVAVLAATRGGGDGTGGATAGAGATTTAGGGANAIPAGHRLVASRSIVAPHSLRYTVALSVPRRAADAPLTISLLAAQGHAKLRFVERKPLPDRFRFRRQSYVNDFSIAPHADGSGGVGLSYFVDPSDKRSEVTCSLDVSLAGIAYNGCT